MRAAVVRYPALPLAVVAVGTFIWFAAANGGYDGTTWYPGALIVLALVVIGATTVPAARTPRIVTIAVVALAAYAAWSYLSIGWAAQKGDAWDGANRSLLYALSFALFAAWRPRARPAVALLVVYSLGVAAVGLVELLRAASAADPRSMFSEGRFASPAGYMNANVALWFSALWPCVTLGARRELAPFLRGLLVGAAVLLCGLAVLGQSRGWLFTAPVAALLFIAIVPQRVRTTLTLALVLGATGVVTDTLLDVYRAAGERGFADTVSSAAQALIAAAVVAGVAAGLVALADRRTEPTPAQRRRAGRVLAVVAVLAAVGGLAVFVAAKGSPFTVASRAWHEFKTEPSPYGGESRFTGSLGTHRYDFWRVAWDRFESAPIAGIGSDNFQEAYLARRHSDNAPKYPHSVELRAISQTGIVGTALLVVGMGAGLWAALLAVRRRSGLGAAAAAAATASFLYWLVHGTVDWFWEFPALGAPAFALLGLAAGLLPRPAGPAPRGTRRSSLWARVAGAPAVLLVLALVPAVSLGGPWLAEVEQKSAVSKWTKDPAAAYDHLASAAALNPLSAAPRLYGGSIAVRLGHRARAERYFRQALERDPDDAYAHLELGALLAQTGHPREAIATLARARRLDPRDDITAGVLRRVRRGKPVDIARVNRQLAARSRAAGR
jgi:O-antigen ligase/polysaccharide polymerase Wzy-like membrane protein/tetratricopeptide repeat protein